MDRGAALLTAGLLIMTTTTTGITGCTAEAPTGQADNLRALFDEDWRYWMSQHPEMATTTGYPGQNARWSDYSPEAIAARKAQIGRVSHQLAAFDRTALGPADQLNYDLYRGLIDLAQQGLRFEYDALPIPQVIPYNLQMPITQMSGIQQDIPRVMTFMPSASLADYDNIVKRLQTVATLIDQTIALMQQGLARGATPPRVAMGGVPSQVEAQIVQDPLTSPLLEKFRAFPPAIAAADRQRLTTAATDAYTNSVRPAFVRLRDFLVQTYLPKCRDTIAATALPDGADFYAYNIAWHTTTTLTPKAIHEIGLGEVARIRGEMDRIIAQVGFKGGFDAFKTFLRTSPQFFYTDAHALVSGYRDIAKRADPELARLFGTLPRTPYGVQRIPDAIAPSQTTAYYEPGALVAGRPGNMYANTYKLESRPKWEMEALTLHEAVPGHHLQIARAQELENLPDFRKHASSTAYVEGWALYSESLGDEMGFYRDPYSKFGQLTYDMWRAVRLVVDTGIHALGWSRRQAIDYFLANTAKTEQDITVEVDRYIVWPGQALGYKIGQLRLQQLRARAEKELGSAFDLRRFHDAVLGEGALPLDVLERRVMEQLRAGR